MTSPQQSPAATARAGGDIDMLCINTIRTLAMDAVQKAESGHPGTPMALTPLGYALFTKHMKHDPADPRWPDRDRFVLSCGHASMLLYSCQYLSGYDLAYPVSGPSLAAWVITSAVAGPMPGSAWSEPSLIRRSSSAAESARVTSAARRKARTR